jgi:chemotaxis methyl-accepting protein methylase
MGYSKNIMEDILRYFLERNLSLRFDICTCFSCKRKMMSYLLSRLPSKYLDSDDPLYPEIEKDIIKKYLKDIFEEINNAVNLVSKNVTHVVEEDKEQAFNYLLARIREERGIDFSQYHKNILKRRIALRLAANRVKSYSEYLKILTSTPKEYEKLFEALCINVSEFFRDPSVWIKIKKILKRIIEKNNKEGTFIKVWSAGCARGEEPYSLAILFREVDKIEVPLIIYATDVDRDCLEYAKRGVYEPMRVKNVSADILERHFVLSGSSYKVRDEIRQMVEFDYLDLTSSEYVPNLDLILCRNVFIYFTKPLQEQILDRFYQVLRKDGYLVIGQTENLVPGAKLIFKEIDAHHRIYQKITLR